MGRERVSWRVAALWAAAGTVTTVPLYLLYRYRRLIRKRLHKMEQELSQPLMKRVLHKKRKTKRSIRVLELNPEFVQLHKTKWQLTSLGSYLSSLTPAHSKMEASSSQMIQREMEAWIGATLLRQLGPRLGSVALPMLGFSNVSTTFTNIATTVASWFASHFILDAADHDPTSDRGVLPFSLYELSAFANLNERFVNSKMTTTPLELLKQGEVGYSPSFGTDVDIPCPFIMSLHWDKAIADMEHFLMDDVTSTTAPPMPQAESVPMTQSYDPHDCSLPAPTPVNERLLPDLYLGWGDAQCTHSKREIVRNRLLAVLFNKLAHNYHLMEQREREEAHFSIQMEDKESSPSITTAWTFCQALIASGHDIEICPRATITTFGIALCVKEPDESWTNIPLGYFFKTGYEITETSRSAHIGVPHGGMDLSIRGPLLGTNDDGLDHKCNIQFYMAIEGLCGWHSNHNANVPWIQPTNPMEPYSNENAVKAVRMASMLAVTFNAIGTERALPFGGYGVLGVCNDTAAILDQAIRGTTNMYPLVSTGRFLMHISKRLNELLHGLEGRAWEEERKDLLRLIAATMDVGSDLHAAPCNVVSGANRFLSGLPKVSVFDLQTESREVMTALKNDFETYRIKRQEIEKNWSWKKPGAAAKHIFEKR